MVYLWDLWILKCIYFYFQPVDLLPFRIEDARRQLEADGDFSFEGLQILREAEDERRGKKWVEYRKL